MNIDPVIDLVFKNMELERKNKILSGNQLTLGALIELLEEAESRAKDDKCRIVFDFGQLKPGELHSWRGIYSELAISYDNPYDAHLIGFLNSLRNAIGKTYEGWKGGGFTMDENTPMWASNPGEGSSTAITGIKNLTHNDNIVHQVILVTEYKEPYDN